MEEIPQTIGQLKETIEAEPGENPRLERIAALSNIQELIGRQLSHLQESQNFTSDKAGVENLYRHLQQGKTRMDDIRKDISAMQNKEETLLGSRIEEINSIRNRDYLVIFITLLIAVLVRGISFYLFDRGIVRRINRVTEYIDSTIKRRPAHSISSDKTDAIGMLEKKVTELCEQKAGF
jgi:CHASE3 domain sensor protein